MNCNEARALLPLFIYGDLEPQAAEGLEAHLAACPACAAERKALTCVQSALSAVSTPPAVMIDVPRLYADLRRAEQRRARQWRWAAMFIAATAASLAFVVLATRMELRVEEHQLVVRWGSPPPNTMDSVRPQSDAVAVLPDRRDARVAPTAEDQVRVLSRLVHTIVKDSAKYDEDNQRDINWLKVRVRELQGQMDRRFLDTEKDLRTLYKWQFVRNEKGELQ